MKKELAKFIYKIIQKYIRIEKWQSPTTLNLQFTLYVFDERVSEIEITKENIEHRRIL